MNYVLAILLAGTVYLMFDFSLEKQYQKGYKDAQKAALRTDPPSEELELVCAGLWVGEQNKKADRKWHSK